MELIDEGARNDFIRAVVSSAQLFGDSGRQAYLQSKLCLNVNINKLAFVREVAWLDVGYSSQNITLL